MAIAAPHDLLERIDRIMAELAALRAAVAGEKGICTVDTLADDDLAEANLLDTGSAAWRYGYPKDTLRKWCREEDLGVMRGGRWLVSIPRLRRRLSGG